jgi:hypothetical protein
MKSPVATVLGLALYKQLLARRIELPVTVCEAIQAAVIAEAAGVADEMTRRSREREPA